MSWLTRATIALTVAGAALTASPAMARGWHRGHSYHHYYHHRGGTSFYLGVGTPYYSDPYYYDPYYYPAPVYPAPVYYGPYYHRRHYRHRTHFYLGIGG